MAILTQIRLPQLTGSIGTGAAHDIGEANISTRIPVAGQPGGDSLAGVLQLFADKIGALSGVPDWTDAQAGEYLSLQGSGNDISIRVEDFNQRLKLQSDGEARYFASGSVTFAASGESNSSLRIGTGGDFGDPNHANGASAQGVSILSQQNLQLSSSQGNIEITQPADNRRITVKSGQSGPGALILSASHANGTLRQRFQMVDFAFAEGDMDLGTGIDFRMQQGFGPAGAIALRAMQEGKQLSLKAGDFGGRLRLSGSHAQRAIVFEGCMDDAGDSNSGPNQAGDGTIALWSTDGATEPTDWVTDIGSGVSIMGAIMANKSSISENALPTLLSASIDNTVLPNSNVDIGKVAGGNPSLAGHKVNALQVMLNGQLLISSAGDPATAVGSDGDYKVASVEPDQLKFGFNLEAGDQIRVFYFG